MMAIMNNVNSVGGDFGMKVSRERMAENRCRILDAASRLFRAKGFEAVSVAEVMKATGLTHGGLWPFRFEGRPCGPDY